MWRLVAVTLLIVGNVVGARANDPTGLESCFQAARLADAICSRLENDPVQRLDCFQKTRAAQLECLEHVLSELSPKATVPARPSGSVRPEPPANSAPSTVPSEANSSKEPVPPRTAEAPTGTVSVEPPAAGAEAKSPGRAAGPASGSPGGQFHSAYPAGRTWQGGRRSRQQTCAGLGGQRDDISHRLHAAADGRQTFKFKCEGWAQHPDYPLPWTAHRASGSHRGYLGRAARRRTPGRLSGQRAGHCEAAMDLVTRWKDGFRQRRSGRASQLAAGKRPT